MVYYKTTYNFWLRPETLIEEFEKQNWYIKSTQKFLDYSLGLKQPVRKYYGFLGGHWWELWLFGETGLVVSSSWGSSHYYMLMGLSAILQGFISTLYSVSHSQGSKPTEGAFLYQSLSFLPILSIFYNLERKMCYTEDSTGMKCVLSSGYALLMKTPMWKIKKITKLF